MRTTTTGCESETIGATPGNRRPVRTITLPSIPSRKIRFGEPTLPISVGVMVAAFSPRPVSTMAAAASWTTPLLVRRRLSSDRSNRTRSTPNPSTFARRRVGPLRAVLDRSGHLRIRQSRLFSCHQVTEAVLQRARRHHLTTCARSDRDAGGVGRRSLRQHSAQQRGRLANAFDAGYARVLMFDAQRAVETDARERVDEPRPPLDVVPSSRP